MSECTDWMTEVRWKLVSVSTYGRRDVYEGLNVARNEAKRNWGRRERLHSRSITQYFWWRCGQGTHPFPSRTRWLRPDRPMVLHWRRCGRAGGRQTIKNLIRLPKANEFRFLGRSLNEEKRTSIWKKKWMDLYQWSEIKKDFGFWWLINISQTCTLKTAYKNKSILK